MMSMWKLKHNLIGLPLCCVHRLKENHVNSSSLTKNVKNNVYGSCHKLLMTEDAQDERDQIEKSTGGILGAIFQGLPETCGNPVNSLHNIDQQGAVEEEIYICCSCEAALLVIHNQLLLNERRQSRANK